MNDKLIETLAKNALPIALGAAGLLALVYYLGRKTIADTADLAAGIVSGDNAITEGTQYEGTGVAGTVGAVADAASGGLFSSWGSSLADWFAPSVADSDVYFAVLFPDGATHAIHSTDIKADSTFEYSSAVYRLGINPRGLKIATLI